MRLTHAETLSLINILLPILGTQRWLMNDDQKVALIRLTDRITEWGFEIKE